MILLNRWWGVLAAGMVGAVVGAWVGLGVKWIAEAGEVAISRGAAIGGLLGLYGAIALALRRPPFTGHAIAAPSALGVVCLPIPGLLPTIQMAFAPGSLVMVLLSVVVSCAITGLLGACYAALSADAARLTPDVPTRVHGGGVPYDREADEPATPATSVRLYDQARERAIIPRGVGAYERQQARAFLDARARAGEEREGYRTGDGSLSLGALG